MTAVALPNDLELLLAELERRETAPHELPAFLDWLPARVQRYSHVVLLCDALQRIADGHLSRLMVFMPPRHGKSELVSRWFTAYYLARYPERRVLLASYGATLAGGMARNARDNFAEMGGVLAIDQAARTDWATSAGGGMRAVGIGSGVVGHGGHLKVIDDSVKDPQDAASDTIARSNREWYDGAWLNRSEPGNAQIIVTTRWPGKADLAGYALEQEAGDHPERWEILALDAIKDAEPWEFPPTCTVLPGDWRAVGEPLCEARTPMAELLKYRERSGFYFSALFQQRPKARDGVLFRWDDFVMVNAAPVATEFVSIVRYWDMAGTDVSDTNDPDATAGVLMARHKDGTFWLLDRSRIVAAVSRRDAFIKATADADRAAYGSRIVQWFEQQTGIGGAAAMQALTRLLAGHRVQSEPATGSKEIRAEPYVSQVQAHNIRLVAGAWCDSYRLEMCAFPFGPHDDDVDASSGAFAKCADRSGSVGVFSFSLG